MRTAHRSSLFTALGAFLVACAASTPPEGAVQNQSADPTVTAAELDRACRADDFQACADFGWLIYAEAVDPDEALHVLELFERACEGRAGDGCSGLGVAYFEGLGVAQDFRRAYEYWHHSCELDSGSGCAHLGVALLFGLGARADALWAAEVWAKACDLGEPDGCRFAGDMHLQEGPARDLVSAVAFWERGCALGDPESCVTIARQLYIGTLIPVDRGEALAYFEEACALGGAAGCVNAGNLYRYGEGVEADLEAALTHYQRACELVDARGCQLAGSLTEHQECLARGRTDCAATPDDDVLECTGESGFGVVTVTDEQYARRTGAGATELRALQTSRERPAEVCLLDGELEFLLGLYCADGSRPFDDGASAHQSRAGNVGAGGRCGRTVDLYVVPCPEGSYQVYLDMYVCPARVPNESL